MFKNIRFPRSITGAVILGALISIGLKLIDVFKSSSPTPTTIISTNSGTNNVATHDINQTFNYGEVDKKKAPAVPDKVSSPSIKKKRVIKENPAETNINNGINNGNIGGQNNTVNVIGMQPRHVTEEYYTEFNLLYPDKHTRIAFDFINTQDGEQENLKSELTKLFRSHGYDDIGELSGFRRSYDMPKKLSIDPQPDGSVYIIIPPLPVNGVASN
jgi:hypothetical protein